MTKQEARQIDMVSYLSAIGYEPANQKGANYWYRSPFREETTPSFKINRYKNVWYDFGEGKGGTLIDFICLKEHKSIAEVLHDLSNWKTIPPAPVNKTHHEQAIKIISVHPITSLALIRYYQSRSIIPAIAEQFLQEVRYENGDKSYYALGFSNDAGGYELRSAYFKGSCHPKASTFIPKESQELAVFEGFFDFLSYCTMHCQQPAPIRDFLILNSTSFFERELPRMQAYQRVHLYLDHDKTGERCTQIATQIDPEHFIDERSLYAGYKDLNDWHTHMGKARPKV